VLFHYRPVTKAARLAAIIAGRAANHSTATTARTSGALSFQRRRQQGKPLSPAMLGPTGERQDTAHQTPAHMISAHAGCADEVPVTRLAVQLRAHRRMQFRAYSNELIFISSRK